MIVKDVTSGNFMESENALVVGQWKKYSDRYVEQKTVRGKTPSKPAPQEDSPNQ